MEILPYLSSYLILHLALHLFMLALQLVNIVKCDRVVILISFFIPVFGFLFLVISAIVYQFYDKKQDKRGNEFEDNLLKITDETKRSVMVQVDEDEDTIVPVSEARVINKSKIKRELMKDILYDMSENIDSAEDDVQQSVVPIEEALIMNDSRTKRELIMDVLYANPSDYIVQLASARNDTDTEVVHYAVTALAEIQKEFEQKFQELSLEMVDNPDDSSLQLKYQNLLERYLKSGLLEGNSRIEYLQRYSDVLEKRIADSGDKLSLWCKKADTDFKMEDAEALYYDAQKIISNWPDKEQGYLFMVKCGALKKDRALVDSTVNDMKTNSVHISRQGRDELAFWFE